MGMIHRGPKGALLSVPALLLGAVALPTVQADDVNGRTPAGVSGTGNRNQNRDSCQNGLYGGSVLCTPADLLTKSDGTRYPDLDTAAKANNRANYGSPAGQVIVEIIPGTFEQAVGAASSWSDAAARIGDGDIEWYDTSHDPTVVTDAYDVPPAFSSSAPSPADAQARVAQLAADGASYISSNWTTAPVDGVLGEVLTRG
ncbi:hypothetical protein ACQ86D_50510 [Streptomyces galilaeus]